MLQAKCLPALMYGLDACPVYSTETKSLEFALFRVYAKLFGTISKSVLEECCSAFGIESLVSLTSTRKLCFLNRYVASLNEVCSVVIVHSAICQCCSRYLFALFVLFLFHLGPIVCCLVTK